jgi:hypothetical protein
MMEEGCEGSEADGLSTEATQASSTTIKGPKRSSVWKYMTLNCDNQSVTCVCGMKLQHTSSKTSNLFNHALKCMTIKKMNNRNLKGSAFSEVEEILSGDPTQRLIVYNGKDKSISATRATAVFNQSRYNGCNLMTISRGVVVIQSSLGIIKHKCNMWEVGLEEISS